MLANHDRARPNYEDRLRALGWFLDREGLYQLRLSVEGDDFLLLVKSRQTPDQAQQEVRFNSQEIESLRHSAIRRRGQGTHRSSFRPSRLTALHERQGNGSPLSAWLEEARALPYQEVLRIIGREMDLCKAGGFRVEEQANNLLVRIRVIGIEPDIYQVHSLSKEDLRVRVAKAIRQRKIPRTTG